MEEIQFAIGNSSLGLILIAHSNKGICSIMIGDQQKELIKELIIRFPKSTLLENGSIAAKLLPKLVELVEKPHVSFNYPLDLRGTSFQKKVWLALTKIPQGETISYRTLAETIGLPKAVRAAAQACGANPIAIVIPCHRVIKSDGSLSGYRWGVERKRKLLDREQHNDKITSNK